MEKLLLSRKFLQAKYYMTTLLQTKYCMRTSLQTCVPIVYKKVLVYSTKCVVCELSYNKIQELCTKLSAVVYEEVLIHKILLTVFL